MDRDVQLAVILLAVIVVGGLLLWAVRTKASAWADQYDKAAAEEARGIEADYPVIGYRARRISWREATFLIAALAVIVAVVVFLESWPAAKHDVRAVVGIENPRQIAFLTGFILFTVFSLVFAVRFFLRRSGLGHSSVLHKAVVGPFLLLVGIITSLLFYQALVTGETYCLGRSCRGDLVHVSGNPSGYWLLVAVWYMLAWISLSSGIFTLLRHNQPSLRL